MWLLWSVIYLAGLNSNFGLDLDKQTTVIKSSTLETLNIRAMANYKQNDQMINITTS